MILHIPGLLRSSTCCRHGSLLLGCLRSTCVYRMIVPLPESPVRWPGQRATCQSWGRDCLQLTVGHRCQTQGGPRVRLPPEGETWRRGGRGSCWAAHRASLRRLGCAHRPPPATCYRGVGQRLGLGSGFVVGHCGLEHSVALDRAFLSACRSRRVQDEPGRLCCGIRKSSGKEFAFEQEPEMELTSSSRKFSVRMWFEQDGLL